MSRRIADRDYRITQTAITAVYVLLIGLLAAVTAVAGETGDPRSSTTAHYVEGGRDAKAPSLETNDRFAELDTTSKRASPGAEVMTSPEGDTPATARSTAYDFWIYDADVVLFGDDDADGFFYGIDLLFDADTLWSSARVYGVVYLSFEGGPWNEYVITDDFLISGAVSDDEYLLVTELESGYPTGDYDLLIELYDSATGDFLADFGPESSSALGYLPLEDYNRDAPYFDAPVAVSHRHGGGSAGWLTLAVLGIAAAFRTGRRRL